jgi:hypothetical protein
MMTRTGNAVWEGTLKKGKGKVKLGSGAFEVPFSFASRFEDGKWTNPEELLGAAHAGCFSISTASNPHRRIVPARLVSATLRCPLGMVSSIFRCPISIRLKQAISCSIMHSRARTCSLKIQTVRKYEESEGQSAGSSDSLFRDGRGIRQLGSTHPGDPAKAGDE